ncbi:hypothetical protein [Klugiella xanthotipulae]|nr:hypothetical protein [Klugiella xanthotipulae]
MGLQTRAWSVLGQHLSWPDVWRVRLAGLRCSPYAEVRERALRQRVEA